MIREKCDLNLKVSQNDSSFGVSIILVNNSDSEIKFSTSSSKVFDLQVFNNETDEELYYKSSLQTFAVERWKLPSNDKMIDTIKILYPEKARKRLRDNMSKEIYENEDQYEKSLEQEIKMNSLDLNGVDELKIEAYLNLFDKEAVEEKRVVNLDSIGSNELPETSISEYRETY